MILDQSSKNDFLERLSYFGGAIIVSTGETSKRYQDLEQFVVDATRIMSEDVRVTQCFLNWLTPIWCIALPFKTTKIIEMQPTRQSRFGCIHLSAH